MKIFKNEKKNRYFSHSPPSKTLAMLTFKAEKKNIVYQRNSFSCDKTITVNSLDSLSNVCFKMLYLEFD